MRLLWQHQSNTDSLYSVYTVQWRNLFRGCWVFFNVLNEGSLEVSVLGGVQEDTVDGGDLQDDQVTDTTSQMMTRLETPTVEMTYSPGPQWAWGRTFPA